MYSGEYKDKTIISLGRNCNPRIYLKNKFNLSKSSGYKSCPFDLCITPFKSLYEVLSNDFDTFFEDLYSHKSHIGNKHNIIFNHEAESHCKSFKDGKNDPEYYTRNNFDNFHKRYKSRIDNFRNYLKSSKSILFVYESYYPGIKGWTNNKDDIFDENKIREVIKKFYGNKEINFLNITIYN